MTQGFQVPKNPNSASNLQRLPLQGSPSEIVQQQFNPPSSSRFTQIARPNNGNSRLNQASFIPSFQNQQQRTTQAPFQFTQSTRANRQFLNQQTQSPSIQQFSSNIRPSNGQLRPSQQFNFQSQVTQPPRSQVFFNSLPQPSTQAPLRPLVPVRQIRLEDIAKTSSAQQSRPQVSQIDSATINRIRQILSDPSRKNLNPNIQPSQSSAQNLFNQPQQTRQPPTTESSISQAQQFQQTQILNNPQRQQLPLQVAPTQQFNPSPQLITPPQTSVETERPISQQVDDFNKAFAENKGNSQALADALSKLFKSDFSDQGSAAFPSGGNLFGGQPSARASQEPPVTIDAPSQSFEVPTADFLKDQPGSSNRVPENSNLFGGRKKRDMRLIPSQHKVALL